MDSNTVAGTERLKRLCANQERAQRSWRDSELESCCESQMSHHQCGLSFLFSPHLFLNTSTMICNSCSASVHDKREKSLSFTTTNHIRVII